MEEDTLSEYPLQIMSTGLDMTSRMLGAAGGEDSPQGEVTVIPMAGSMMSQVDANDLKSLKAYLDSFVADCVVNGLDDAKWEKHLKDVEGYRASEWVQWYQDYIDKKF